MPTSYDGTLLDHLAKHIMYLSSASSFWFSLNSSYNHDCHLSKRLGVSPQDYEYLLVAADLAHIHQQRVLLQQTWLIITATAAAWWQQRGGCGAYPRNI